MECHITDEPVDNDPQNAKDMTKAEMETEARQGYLYLLLDDDALHEALSGPLDKTMIHGLGNILINLEKAKSERDLFVWRFLLGKEIEEMVKGYFKRVYEKGL